jgi:uncharacterized protein YbaR (Trm112 family)
MNSDVLEVIVDPTDRQPLQYIESENCFYNERTHTKYPIVDNGIAVFLVNSVLADGATVVSDDGHQRLSALVKDGKSITTGVKG